MRAKKEIAPLLEEYFEFFSSLLAAMKGDEQASRDEYLSKLREDDHFALVDMKDSLEGGKKSASQVKAEFEALVDNARFEEYISHAFTYALNAEGKKWKKLLDQMQDAKNDVLERMDKTAAIIDKIVGTLKSSNQLEKYKEALSTLEYRYYNEIKSLREKLVGNRRPATIIRIQFERIVNSEKFKIFIKNTYELTKKLNENPS